MLWVALHATIYSLEQRFLDRHMLCYVFFLILFLWKDMYMPNQRRPNWLVDTGQEQYMDNGHSSMV
jgi:hypothetical protein